MVNSIEEKNNIKEIYQNYVNSMFPNIYTNISNNKIERVIFRIIHNDEDLNLNCNDREILYTCQDIFGSDFWCFKENIFGKSLCANFNHIDKNLNFPDFEKFFTIYKKHYMDRMNLIISQYDGRFQEPIKDNSDENVTSDTDTKLLADYKNNSKIYEVYLTYKLDYDKFKIRILELKKIPSPILTKLLISKIPNLIKDTSKYIYDFLKEDFKVYFDLRDDIEKMRHYIKDELYELLSVGRYY